MAHLLETGEQPPPPAIEGNRSTQVNVRLTVEEKALLETRARAKGFRGLSDFIRGYLEYYVHILSYTGLRTDARPGILPRPVKIFERDQPTSP